MTDTQALDTTDIIKENVQLKTASYTLKAVKAYRVKHKDKIIDYHKQYYQKNKEELKQKRAAKKIQNDKHKEQIDTLTENIATKL